MARHFHEPELVLATHNAGKAREIGAMLKPFAVTVRSAAELGLTAPEETGATCLENARLKALTAARASGLPALADDSGLEIFALDGWPGVVTAELAGPERNYELAMHRILDRLAGNPDMSCRFVSVLALAWPDDHIETVEGEVRGRLVYPARGGDGWGFDPYFVPAGHQQAFAEMPHEAKNALSHRAAAFSRLVDVCFR